MNVVMSVEMNVVTVVLFYMFAAKPVENINVYVNVTNVNTGKLFQKISQKLM